MNGQTKSYKSDILAGPYNKTEIPDIQIDYRRLITYARDKGCRVCDLTDEEKNLFIINADMATVRKHAIKL